MSLALFVYLASILPKVAGVFTAVVVILLMCLALHIFLTTVQACEINKTFTKIAIPAILISGLLSALIPSEKQMYLIGGALVVQKTLEDPRVNQINDKVFKIINDKLDEYTKEEVKAQKK